MEQLDRSAKSLAVLSQDRLAAPQLGGAAVEVHDRARGVAGIDGDRAQIEKGAVALLAGAQRRLGLLALNVFILQLDVQRMGDPGEFVLANQAEDQRLVHGAHLFLEAGGFGHETFLYPFAFAFGSGGASGLCGGRGPARVGMPVVSPSYSVDRGRITTTPLSVMTYSRMSLL